MAKSTKLSGTALLVLMFASSPAIAGDNNGKDSYYQVDGLNRHAVWKEFLHDRGQLPTEELYVRTTPRENQEIKTVPPGQKRSSNNSVSSGFYYQGDGMDRHAVWKEFLHDRGQLPEEETYVITSPEENREVDS